MITRFLLLGATGDMAGRHLLPALAESAAAGTLPDGLQVVGAAPQDWDDDAFRQHVATRLTEHAADVPAEVRDALVAGLRYRQVDFTAPATVAAAVAAFDGAGPVAAYLALPPTAFPPALTALGEAGLPAGSRIAVEKPFGADLASAAELDALLTKVTGGVEEAAYRVDHFLGMPGVQALLALHAPGSPLVPGWGSETVSSVEVLWQESLGLAGRSGFYDRNGAIRDVLQNHLLQSLTLLVMEQPASDSEADLHAAKLAALRAVRVVGPATTRRARYSAGTLADGTQVPDYAADPEVDPARGTETFVELELVVDTPRWAGTRFLVRTGKALARDHKGVVLTFRGTAPQVDPALAERPADDRLWVTLDGAVDAGADVSVHAPGERTAYRQVLADVLSGGSRTSVSSAETEQAWRVVDPVLTAWAAGEVPLQEYPAGSEGPA
ncbi:glucose-6-phosphate dehydrogenase [Modestobacter sp. VKM Ac-2986]|uniref:glucose-6-phosphate dehydrogenase n=1 Tax=Modestobacter sp. VKM Ac-2986 TaxID=3004140 RepID=UPI0022AADEA0|nr:glucose-6-phosphate dehydrogenase [Modestobacter sp. VKM Ac-2986]MCZ2829105.1 glucose-6-phosphate dehydrogenase [Modestobacter sp. VKM Ac-2986]